MSDVPGRETFESMYARKPPWDIGRPQPALVEDRARYVAGLTHVTRPGGRLLLICFSDGEPDTQGPRRVSEREIRQSFSEGWTIEEIRPTRFEVRPDLEGFSFSQSSPRAWFSVMRRLG